MEGLGAGAACSTAAFSGVLRRRVPRTLELEERRRALHGMSVRGVRCKRNCLPAAGTKSTNAIPPLHCGAFWHRAAESATNRREFKAATRSAGGEPTANGRAAQVMSSTDNEPSHRSTACRSARPLAGVRTGSARRGRHARLSRVLCPE